MSVKKVTYREFIASLRDVCSHIAVTSGYVLTTIVFNKKASDGSI